MSLRELPGSLYRAFDQQDTVDVVTRLSLIAILFSDHVAGFEWFIKAPLRTLAVLGMLIPPLHRSPWLWGTASAVFVLRTLVDWWFQDNHLFVFTYWCLTLALALRLAQPEKAIATSARLLIGLSFAFATLWKGFLSPDYLDGSYFHFTLLADVRFQDLASIVGRVPDAAFAVNAERLEQLQAWRPDVEAVALESTPYLALLAQVLTWWTVAIEGLLALTFLWPREGKLRRLRNAVLILFGVTTYTVATVPTFGWTLLTLGAAQCTRDERIERFLYALTCVLVLVYSYVEILSLVKPFVPSPS